MTKTFLDALSHLYKRVCPFVGRSVRLSVRLSVTHKLNFWKSNDLTKIEQNSTKNMKLFHLKDNSETSTQADRQNASDVWTPSDLFLLKPGFAPFFPYIS